MPDWLMLGLALAYLGLLFLIAWIGDRQTGLTGGRAPIVYSLSIGVYCTSWTLYGAVGVAAHSGLNYLAIYVGPILVMLVGWRLIARMVRIAKAENLVSISDFIAARYGKSHTIAVLVTLSATVGLLPYFALQLKAITLSFEMLTGRVSGDGPGGLPDGTTLLVTAAMAVFALLFGVRSVNANEPHRGLMLAVAVELVIKLAAALLVGGAITFAGYGSPGALLDAVAARPILPNSSRPRRSTQRHLQPSVSRPWPFSACRVSFMWRSSRTPIRRTSAPRHGPFRSIWSRSISSCCPSLWSAS